jgi:RNA polymerase sigma factor (sigma-70 family)
MIWLDEVQRSGRFPGEEVKEAVQGALLRLRQRHRRAEGSEGAAALRNLKAFLFRCVVNHRAEAAREARIRGSHEALAAHLRPRSAPPAEALLEQTELRMRVREALFRLDAFDLTILLMVEIQGLPQEAVARHLSTSRQSISASTVRRTQVRVRERLAELLRRDLDWLF